MTAALEAVMNEPAVSHGPAAYAVFGNPIKHSKSPAIHGAFAAQFGADVSYRAVAVPLEAFEEKVAAFFRRGGSGLNVTVPFKERAWAMADSASDRASKARAANCLIPLEGGGLHADNTDGLGMVRDMVINQGWQLAGRRTLVLGAGGAVRGILQPLLAERPASLTVVNRTAERAQQLATEFADAPLSISAGGFDSVAGCEFDLIINGTSAGLAGEMPDLPEGLLSERCCCYDLVYQSEPTAFMRWAAARAAWAVTDGLGMLVEQAAESFYLWRQQRPSTAPVIQQLRELMTP